MMQMMRDLNEDLLENRGGVALRIARMWVMRRINELRGMLGEEVGEDMVWLENTMQVMLRSRERDRETEEGLSRIAQTEMRTQLALFFAEEAVTRQPMAREEGVGGTQGGLFAGEQREVGIIVFKEVMRTLEDLRSVQGMLLMQGERAVARWFGWLYTVVRMIGPRVGGETLRVTSPNMAARIDQLVAFIREVKGEVEEELREFTELAAARR
ncbi:hypothetical protein QBC39DRAFT_341489 [Podospora conica]|nr:hypothetical protein QBC39DRAFT_341489 [Schizothecium conicum]